MKAPFLYTGCPHRTCVCRRTGQNSHQGPATAPPPRPRQPQQQDRGPCPQTDPSPEHRAREHEKAWGCPQKGPPHARQSTDTWEGPTPEPQGLRETALHAEQGPLTRSRQVWGGDCGNVTPPGPEGGMQPAGPQPLLEAAPTSQVSHGPCPSPPPQPPVAWLWSPVLYPKPLPSPPASPQQRSQLRPPSRPPWQISPPKK